VSIARYSGKTNLSKDITSKDMPQIAKNLNTIVFKTVIRESIAVREAQALRKSLYDHAPNSTTAEDYMQLVSELVKLEV